MPERTILLVDKDLAQQSALVEELGNSGFFVEKAPDGKAAIEIIQENDPSRFTAVLADYRHGGSELLDWLRIVDSGLSVVMTGHEESPEVVEGCLRRGAADWVRKPSSKEDITGAMNKAYDRTLRARRLNTAEKNIRAVARMNHLFRSIQVPELAPWLQLHHTPHEDVGGDFVNVLPLAGGKQLMLVGDVSGHDLRAGFVSAYFQGLVRGLCHNGGDIVETCNAFNEILLREWEQKNSKNPMKVEPRTSLSLLAVELDPATQMAKVVNCGAPAVRLAMRSGEERTLEGGNMPLGWSTAEPITAEVLDMKDVAMIYLATDGLHDWADRLGNSSLGLAYRLLEKRQSPGGTPPDDLLFLRYQHARDVKSDELWHPLGRTHKTQENTIQEMAERLQGLLKINLRNAPGVEKICRVLRAEGKPLKLASVAVRPGDGKVKMRVEYADGSEDYVRVLGTEV